MEREEEDLERNEEVEIQEYLDQAMENVRLEQEQEQEQEDEVSSTLRRDEEDEEEDEDEEVDVVVDGAANLGQREMFQDQMTKRRNKREREEEQEEEEEPSNFQVGNGIERIMKRMHFDSFISLFSFRPFMFVLPTSEPLLHLHRVLLLQPRPRPRPHRLQN